MDRSLPVTAPSRRPITRSKGAVVEKLSVQKAIKNASCVFAAVALSVFGWASANAATVVISGMNVTDAGRVDPTAANSTQPISVATTGSAQVQMGQANGSGNPPELSNAGWNPYGLGDTSHNWWNVESGSVTFNLSGGALDVVWGSPNDDDPSSSNYVSFYSGANGGGNLIGTVRAFDLYSNFLGVNNTTDPGYMISFAPGQFGSVVFGTGPSDFEFAVVGPSPFSVAAVPEPSTWAMMFVGFAGLGYAAFRRSSRSSVSALA
jgi:hypothetical protein